MNPSSFVKLGLLLLLLLGAYVATYSLDLSEWLNPEQLVEYFNSLGSSGPVVFILIMATAVVVSPIPSLPLDLAAGVAFGPFLGTTYAVIGAEIGAIVSFLIGRALGRDVIARLLRVNVVFCQTCSDHHLMGLIFFARLLPVFSFDLISYGAGLTNMSLRMFAVATFFGMIPPTFALTYLGGSMTAIEWVPLLLGLLCVGLFLFLPKLILKNRKAWWVRLIQGEAPEGAGPPVSPMAPAEESTEQCAFCGGQMNRE